MPDILIVIGILWIIFSNTMWILCSLGRAPYKADAIMYEKLWHQRKDEMGELQLKIDERKIKHKEVLEASQSVNSEINKYKTFVAKVDLALATFVAQVDLASTKLNN